jgi:hypothetical protein
MSSEPKSVDEVSSEISPVETSSCSISDCASTRHVTPASPSPIRRFPISKALPVIPGEKINAFGSLHSARYCSDLLVGHQTNACVKRLIQVRRRGYRTFWLSTSRKPPSCSVCDNRVCSLTNSIYPHDPVTSEWLCAPNYRWWSRCHYFISRWTHMRLPEPNEHQCNERD